MIERSLRRILLVEDDPDIQEVTSLLLSHADDFDVRVCGTASEALQVARDFDPDLILLDVMMPGLDGRDAFQEFRAMTETAATPVIFMTGRVEPWEIKQYREMGALGVIPKPFDPETLATTIRVMWDRHEKAKVKNARRQDLAGLKALYVSDLPERLRMIEGAITKFKAQGWDPVVAAALYDTAHRLAGSAAIFGFPEISAAALRVAAFGETPASTGRRNAEPKLLIEVATKLSAALRASIHRDELSQPA